MCLTIPKKVISIDGDNVIVEFPSGDRQNVKSIVELKSGDFCLTQQNIAIYKLNQDEAEEILKLLQNKEGSK
jgi:hydrogenase maturation factor